MELVDAHSRNCVHGESITININIVRLILFAAIIRMVRFNVSLDRSSAFIDASIKMPNTDIDIFSLAIIFFFSSCIRIIPIQIDHLK